MTVVEKRIHGSIIERIVRHRFIKFGIVGSSGTVVNLIVLYINQEILFRAIEPPELRLSMSLAVAIFLATLNNFLWNRSWTWQDRRGKTRHGLFVQIGQYYLASALAIGLQYFFTIFIARMTHYLIANMISILLSAIITYLVNDIWTFAIRKAEAN